MYKAKPDGTVWKVLKNGNLREVAGWIHHSGYRNFEIYITDENGKRRRKHESFHRFIATQLIPNPDNLPVVDHINRVKLDNRVENLRWSTRKDNWYNFEWSLEKCAEILHKNGYIVIPPDDIT